jgi:hypothetical protein
MRPALPRAFQASLGAAVLAAGVWQGAAAGTKPAEGPAGAVPDEKKSDTAQAEALERLHTAGNLVRFGRQEQDPLLLITAARLFLQTPTGAMSESPTPEGQAIEASQKKSESRSLAPAELLAEARALAGEDQALLALADQVESEKKRGALSGPAGGTYQVQAGVTDTFTVAFKAGEGAMVVVMGDGDTDLDLLIYDENGNLIVKDDGRSDQCLVSWVPRWTGNFRIHVRNLGIVYNKYSIAHN